MPPEELASIGYKCKFRHTRWDATWRTCFPLYLGDASDPGGKGWDRAWLDPARPNEMVVIVRTGAAENRHHWVVFGIYGGQGPQEGLYRADYANYPYPVLEFPFPQSVAAPVSPFVIDAIPEEDTPGFDYVYRYIKVRALLPAPNVGVTFTFANPELLAKNLTNCCEYGIESPEAKYVKYTLIQQPKDLYLGAVASGGSGFDIGPLPPEYDGKRHPGVGWYVYRQGPGQDELSKDPNNPTVFTINLVEVGEP